MRLNYLFHWGSELGNHVLNGLKKLYHALVWESSLLLAAFSDDGSMNFVDAAQTDLDTLLATIKRRIDAAVSDIQGQTARTQQEESMEVGDAAAARPISADGSNGVTTAMQQLSTADGVAVSPAANDADVLMLDTADLSHAVSSVASSLSAFSTSSSAVNVNAAPHGGSGVSEPNAKIESGEKNGSDAKENGSRSPEQHQLMRLVKPLFSCITRVGRSLTDLFVQLVKVMSYP
jgi:hypothetical protein